MEFTVLDTDRGAALTGTPWPEYPRPSLRRDSFVNLNGEWDFAVGDPARRSRDGTAKERCGVAKPWPRSGQPHRVVSRGETPRPILRGKPKRWGR